MNKILVTGANGFIGQSLCNKLIKKNKIVRGIVRDESIAKNNLNIEYASVGDINSETNWMHLLSNIDCIIHCAGIAHAMESKNLFTEKDYMSSIVDGTKQLATQAAAAGVRRIIFLSSIKVNGDNTSEVVLDNNNEHKNIFTYKDKPVPKSLYGLAKWKAEKELWEVAAKTKLEVNILRLPLVYGKGVKGNLKRLLMLVRSGVPLPFSMIKNQRSMIGLDNLIDLILICIDHQSAAGKTFLVSDGEDVSTPDLIKHISFSMGRSARLFPVPIILLKIIAKILNRREEIDRLVGSLKVDSLFTSKTLNWSPKINISEGIKKMVSSNDKNI